MFVFQLGHQLERLFRKAQQEIIIVAPFIKAKTLGKLLDVVTLDVRVMCVTRWRMEEIVQGVSDIEIWQVISSRPKATLWLRPDLHAKYYRADKECLVGSANVTDAALGWSNRSNFELFVSSSYEDTGLLEFEQYLLSGSTQVDASLYDQVLRMLEQVERSLFNEPIGQDSIQSSLSDVTDKPIILPEKWLPSLRTPGILYNAYKGELKKLTTTQKEAALVDLASLPVPPGLSLDSFKTSIGLLLLQKPLIQRIDQFVASPQRFGAVRDLLANLPCAKQTSFDANYAWQTTMRWLLYFLPERYSLSVHNYSEIFFRV